MKRSVILFSSSYLLPVEQPSKAQEQKLTLIGKFDNGNIVLTVDKPVMLKAYNAKLAKLSGIEGHFTDISIKETSDKQYMLVFKGNLHFNISCNSRTVRSVCSQYHFVYHFRLFV